ncbi:uncharacterized protein [Cardiocondyla obscurior]|uniref:uncharacterized protein isoform X2 n=1 Tax=Cardiocondyla obscurior TaxID=286306 RepID=UPI00396581BC
MAADEDQASDNKQQQGDQIIVSCARVEVVNAYVTQHSGYSERRRRFRMDIIHRRSNPWISCRINSAAAHRIGINQQRHHCRRSTASFSSPATKTMESTR